MIKARQDTVSGRPEYVNQQSVVVYVPTVTILRHPEHAAQGQCQPDLPLRAENPTFLTLVCAYMRISEETSQEDGMSEAKIRLRMRLLT